MKSYVIFVLLTVVTLFSWGQGKVQVVGTVSDASGEPIIGATVMDVRSKTGTVTDIEGNFVLTVGSNAEIVVSYIGYKEEKVKIKGQKKVYVVLREDSQLLNEVVVTAYGGTQLRSKLTNSISKVKDETFSNGFYSNPAQALSGAVAGMRVHQSSGDPGKVPSIVLRGGTNFDGSGSPLYVIDGQVRGSLNDLNPDDIASMEVMKDAGATAIYGARANNGVVLVTTKRGAKEKTQIGVSMKLSVKCLPEVYDFMNARDYLYWSRMGHKNASQIFQDSKGNWKGYYKMDDLDKAAPFGTGNRYFDAKGNPLDGNADPSAVWSPMNYTSDLDFLLGRGWQTMTDPVYGGEIIFYDFDMADVNIVSPAISQNYSINFSGGNEKGSYYSSLSYSNDEGNAPDNYYNRFNFTFNGDYKIRRWLKSITSFKFSRADWNGLPAARTNEADYFSRVLSAPPTMRGYNHDGEMLLGWSSGDGNQLVNIKSFERNNKRDQFDFTQAFLLTFTEWLSLKLNASWLFHEELNESFNKDYLKSPGVMETSRNSSAEFERYFSQLYNAVFNFKRNWNKHSVDAMLGFEFYDRYRNGIKAAGVGAPTDDFGDLELTSIEEGKRTTDTWHSHERIMSFFGRLNYDYESKYLISLVARRDGYSRLLGDNRFGFFPGISVGWNFGKESFMKSLEHIVSFAKLRMSYGLNGNVSGINYYELQGIYSSNKYDGNVGYYLTDLPNPYLKWEKTHTFEAGLDLSFLNNRVNTSFTYYRRRTKDKYATIPLPVSSGISSIRSNNGELQNQGLEMEFDFRIIDEKDWKWNLSLNAAYNKDKVISLPDNGLENNRQGAVQIYDPNTKELVWVGGRQEGQGMGDFFGFQADGIYKSMEEIPGDLVDNSQSITLYGPEAWSKLTDAQKNPKKALPIQPGDVKWRDINGDNVIDQYDKVKLGNRIPKVTGGINTSVSWKNLSLNIRMDYALGFQGYDSKTPWIMGCKQGQFNTLELTKETWTPENPNAKYPMFYRADQNGKNNYRVSSLFTYNSSYLAFRELTLNYSFPKRWISKIGIQSLDLSVSGQNLGYWTGAKNVYSPEYKNSNNEGGYPLPISCIFGLNLKF